MEQNLFCIFVQIKKFQVQNIEPVLLFIQACFDNFCISYLFFCRGHLGEVLIPFLLENLANLSYIGDDIVLILVGSVRDD